MRQGRARYVLLAMLALAAVPGCAAVSPGMRASVFGTGQVDPDRDQAAVRAAEALKHTPPDVEVYSGKLPDGLDLTEDGSKIVVAPGYQSQFQVIGTVESDYRSRVAETLVRNVYWTFDF